MASRKSIEANITTTNSASKSGTLNNISISDRMKTESTLIPLSQHSININVMTPAALMIVLGVLGSLYHLLALSFEHSRYIVGTPFLLIALTCHVFIAYSGFQMRNTQNYYICIAGSILAMVPISPCCILGLPFGIIALMTLNKSDVKAAFM